MEREPDSLVEQHLSELYVEVLRDGPPVFLSDGKAWDEWEELGEVFPDEP